MDLLIRDIPTKVRSLVCDDCWGDVFSTQAFIEHIWGIGDKGEDDSFFEQLIRYDCRSVGCGLREKATAGCGFCHLVLDTLNRGRAEPDCGNGTYAPEESSVYFRIGRPAIVQTTPLGINHFPFHLNDHSRYYNGVLFLYSDDHDPAGKFVTARPLQTVVNSDATFSQARTWLDRCSFHEKCPESEETILPRRVIEVSMNRDQIIAKLIETKNRETGLYAALSYCWGKEQPGITTLANISERRVQLRTDELSQTVLDAIECAQRLGIRYLWVDAVCIIQDCDQDKMEQVGNMKHVYENAYVTIVAEATDCASKGFLHDKLPTPNKIFRLPFPCPNGLWGSVSCYLDRYPNKESAELFPLHTRAWTLQELKLSGRLLIYAHDTLQFHCLTEAVNLGNSLCMQPIPHMLPRHPRRRHLLLSAERKREVLNEWDGTVYEYTWRLLGRPSDKLPGVAGIAERFSNLLRTSYVAGLWEEHLLPGLLWYCATQGNWRSLKSRPCAYRAPTWSWASVDSQVLSSYTMKGFVPFHTEVIECQVEPRSTAARFGEVVSGQLTIRGLVRKLWYVPPGKLYSFSSNASSTTSATGMVFPDTIETVNQRPGWVYCVAVVLLFDRYSVIKQYGKDASVYGLVLEVVDEANMRFQRIGMFGEGVIADFDGYNQETLTII